MHRASIFLIIFCLAAILLATSSSVFAKHPYSGGETTRVIHKLQKADRSAFAFPLNNLSLLRQDKFFVGNSFFQNAWVSAPASTTARDGLGPLFNTNACQSCHIRDGRGQPPNPNEEMVSMLVRISVPASDSVKDKEYLKKVGLVPHPVYGTQIQNQALPGVPREASVKIEWIETEHKFADQRSYKLRSPQVILSEWGYGTLDEHTTVSARIPPPMIGLGLLNAIPKEDIEKLADPEDRNKDGISGRVNQVWDISEQNYSLGRFGWKASQPNVRQQVASAFSGDIGISSTMFPQQLCTATQEKCMQMPNGGQPEVSDEILDMVTFYSKTLAVPARRSHDSKVILEGEALFKQANCHACHVETFVTGIDPELPELSKQEIHPYTDLLLHDMGEGLADHRPVFDANGREWRTPPLWGIGLTKLVNEHTNFLHDGRARSIEEAILWHGGEAEASKQVFVHLSAQERRKLVAFIKSL